MAKEEPNIESIRNLYPDKDEKTLLFITKAYQIEKHKNEQGEHKYDYSKTVYGKNNREKVIITCLAHGDFEQTPNTHLCGHGCQKCKADESVKRLTFTKRQFVERANIVHHNKYDYSKANYIDSQTKICIICPTHGEFSQKPNNHLRGQGCPFCSSQTNVIDTKSFIIRSNEVHHNKYDYSKTIYKKSKEKVCIICPEHGEFWQIPNAHLNGQGCPKCSNTCHKTSDEFIIKAKEVHNNKYDYSNTTYINDRTKVCIICPEHGEFWQTPNDHLHGHGCKKCGSVKISQMKTKTLEEFIEQAQHIHNRKYTYKKAVYSTSQAKLCIECPEHGEFWQTPNRHLRGQGCPKCSSSLLENKIRNLLSDKYNGIVIEQATCKDLNWLGLQSLDFYLPERKIAIECQGVQHFKPRDFFGGKEELIATQKRDQMKKKKCLENGITLLYYSNLGIDYPYPVFEDENKLLKEINQDGENKNRT